MLHLKKELLNGILSAYSIIVVNNVQTVLLIITLSVISKIPLVKQNKEKCQHTHLQQLGTPIQ